MPEENRGKITLPLEFHVPSDVATKYVNTAIVQRTDSEFVLTFFERFPPLLVGNPDQIAEQLESLESIRATCVARLVLSSSTMSELIELLQQNLDNYHAETAEPEETE